MYKIVLLVVFGWVFGPALPGWADKAPTQSLKGNPDEGRIVFYACQACHSVDEKQNAVGPSLVGIMGRQVGTAEAYDRYSHALKRADFIWTEERLAAWLEDPNAYLPGNRMNFAGIKAEQDRANLIAYLKSLSQ